MMCGHTILVLSLGMLALLGGLPRFMKQESSMADCSGSAPCSLAFLSNNPLSLKCPAASEAAEGTVYWQYQDLSQPQAEPRTFAGPRGLRVYRGPLGKLGSRAILRGGSFILSRARTSDTGLYLCKSGCTTLAAYQVDVQDSSLLHVSHRGLGQSTLSNQTLKLSLGSGPGTRRMVRLYTRWGPWQDCDRCGAMGEQKRLGFCFATLSGEMDEDGDEDAELLDEGGDTLPCGLMERHLDQSLPRRGAELRYQMCRRGCGGEEGRARKTIAMEIPGIGDWWWWGRETALDWLEPRSLLLETVLLDIHDNARLLCPGASVYTPVSWQRDNTLLTRLELQRGGGCNGTHRMDDSTGGGVYHIDGVQPSDRGIYRCWVRGRRVASFHLELPDPPPVHHHLTRQLLDGLRVLVGTFALVFVVSALAEILFACWFDIF
ncbi:protein FAM187B-like [Rhinoraja longicauda]